MHIYSLQIHLLFNGNMLYDAPDTLPRKWTTVLLTNSPVAFGDIFSTVRQFGPCPKGPSVGMHRNATTPVALK